VSASPTGEAEAIGVRRTGLTALYGGSVMALLAAFLWLWGLWSLPLSDPDAGMYADIGARMAASGDWMTPRFNGLRYLEKPPLLYWLIALTYRLAGPSDWGAHLWPALSGVAGVGLTCLVGRSMFGTGVGLVSGLALATSMGYFVYARVVSTDLLFSGFFVLTLWAFFQWYCNHRREWLLMLYGAIGLAIMTKGVIGIALPGAVAIAFLALSRDLQALKSMGLWWGLPLALAIALPWHLGVALRHEGFFSFYVIDNHVLRFLGRRAFVEDDVPLSWVAFLGATFMLFGPWSLCLPAALRDTARKLRGSGPESKALLLVLLWAGCIVSFFALSPLKLEHYGLPAFPALALLVGKYWGDRLAMPGRRSVWLFIPLVMLSIPALLMAVRAVPLDGVVEAMFSTDVYSRMVQAEGHSYALPLVDELIPLFQLGGAVLFLGTLATLFAAARGHERLALCGFILMASALLIPVGKMQWLASEYRSVKPLLPLFTQRLGPEDLLLHEGPLENSAGLTFYTGRQVYVVDGRRGDLDFGSRFPEAHGLFWDGEELSRRWRGPRRLFLVTDRPVEQSALRLIPSQDRHLIGHEGRRWLFANRPE
jgi:4-amino-4-deoxy-L-arabinose transferase-like glycosyltransferase